MAVLCFGASHAQVTITSSGLGTTVAPQLEPTGTTYNITGGTRPNAGPNLFHSFGSFSVGQGDVANFNNDTRLPTSNILGRVTGGETSSIFGTIRTTDFGTANLFLINPAGWVFGPTASLDVGGSFHVSTAHYLRFADGAQFFADPNQVSVLTSAAPTAFGFLGPSAPILVDGSTLQVPEGRTLSIVGGDVQITPGATLSAPSGRVQLGSFASAGEASVDGLEGTFASLGHIELSGSFVTAADVDGDPAIVNGGTVLLRGGQIDITGGSLIDTSGTQTFDANFNLVSTAGGKVVIRGGQLFIDNSFIASNTFGDVDGGEINLALDQGIALTNGSFVGTTASADFGFGPGRGGDIKVAARDVSINGSSVISFTFGEGGAGSVSFNVDTLALTAGGSLGSVTSGNGRGGDVRVTATQSIAISGRDSSSSPSSVFTSTAGISGDAGTLTISAPTLAISDGGAIASVTTAGRGGDIVANVGSLSVTGGASIFSHVGADSSGGNITVIASGPVLVSGAAANGSPSRIFSDSCPTCAGRPGDISVQAKTITVTNLALIQSGSDLNPQGGNVTLGATDGIVISERGGVSTQAQDQDIGPISVVSQSLLIDNGFISTTTLGPGRAGGVSLQVGTLTLTRGGQIASSSERSATGTGGDVSVAANSISISGTSPSGVPTVPFNTDPSSGIFSTTATAGNAGSIRLATSTLNMVDGGKISVSSSGTGNAGTVLADAGTVTLAGASRIESSTSASGAGGAITINASALSIGGIGSGLFSTASATGNAGQVVVSTPALTVADGGKISVATSAAGNAGTVQVNARDVLISGGGRIDSSTTAAGAGGAINISAGNEVRIVSGGSVVADSSAAGLTGNVTIAAGNQIVMNDGSVSTRAATSDGGNITLNAPNIIWLDNSQISTSVGKGLGAGGNVLIDPQFLILNNDSAITANAFGGPGGNITIIAGNFLSSPSSLVQASSALSTPGTIEIFSPENNVAGSIAQLPRAFVDASRLMRGLCSARRAGTPSSFVVAGRGGVPPDADGYLPSVIGSAAPQGAYEGRAGMWVALAGPGYGDCAH